ncbi:hypothetical protein HY256_00530, partial [Candidatus Sumerlaeota bacterium]|nr:hypothetical protein [Candidatus Sumerlaeota bacterium]
MLKLIRTFAATLLLLPALAVDAPAQTVPTASENPPATSTHLAVERGLQFLQKEAYRWKAAKGCAACHHAPLAVWAFNEARAKGYAVDKAALNELTTWEFSATRTNAMSVQPPPRDVLNLGAVYVLLSVEPAPPPVKPAGDSPAIQDQQTPAQNGPPPNPATDPNADPNLADRQFLLQHVVAKQVADGSWGLPMDLRVPLGGPVEDIAILSRIALLQSG